MYSMSLVSLSVLALIGQLVSSTPDNDSPVATSKCFFYSDANTTHATCNDAPDIVCTKGCTGYVTAEKCEASGDRNSQTTDPSSTQNCELGFGRETAAAKACLTKNGPFRCTGNTSGEATCYGCVSKTRRS